MVSPSYYILLRMLEKINYEKTIIDIQRTAECSKKVKRSRHSDRGKTCRVCLKEGTIPIYGIDSNLSEPIILFGGIKLSADDQYAKHICVHCHRLLKCAMLFRKLAMQSDEIKLKLGKSCHSVDNLNDVDDENVGDRFQYDAQGSLPPIRLYPSRKVLHNYYSKKDTENNRKAPTNQILLANKVKIQSAKRHKIICTKTEYLTNNNQNKQITPISIEQFFSDVESDCDQTPNETSIHPTIRKRRIARVQCKICQKIMTKGYSKEHYALHDPTVPKHVCHICGKSFRQKCSLINHRYTHSTEFKFHCKICPYRGRSSMLLKMHMRSHTKDYKFVCTKCPARFTHKSNLNRHTLLQHTVPLFKCETCLREFHTKIRLQQHVTGTHLGIKPHLCNMCDGAFACRRGLMRHQLDVHKREKRAHGRQPDYILADQEQPKQTMQESRAVAEEE